MILFFDWDICNFRLLRRQMVTFLTERASDTNLLFTLTLQQRIPMRTAFLLLIMSLAQTVNAQTCNPGIVAEAPDSRYEIRTATVLDKQTGLVWMRCALGQTWNGTGCTGTATVMVWQTALQAAENTVFAGKNDWRLPNQKELQSLVEPRCYDPAINTAIFPNTLANGFWSSSPRAYHCNYAWIVYFSNGFNNHHCTGSSFAVRLVRAGE